jgi:peptide/nickel transport system permease protein
MSAHVLRFLRTKPLGTFGVFVILVIVFMAIFAEQIDRYDPGDVFRGSGENPDYDPVLAEQALTNPLIRTQHPPEVFRPTLESAILQNEGPSNAHWLGTDGFGHDLYSRIIHGSRVSLQVGIGASLIAVFAGTVFGLISAYFSGMVDIVIQRFVDSLQAFPALILLLLIIQVVSTPSLNFITLALGFLGIAPVIRIVRSSVLSAREEVYVLAANSIGASDSRIMARHILPNIMAPIIVIFSTSISVYILAEAGLSFLGFGDPTAISWGKMVNEGRILGAARPLMALWTGMAITIAVLGFSLFGDALRDALDPRLRGRGKGGF